MQVSDILKEYSEKIIPKMIGQNYHIKMAKGGPEYRHMPEQSMFSHIVNGVFGLGRLINYLIHNGLYRIDEKEFRQVLSQYTLHDMHKLTGKEEKLGGSEFSVPLELIQQEAEKLNITDFGEINLHEVRAANTHARSSHHGDQSLGDSGASRRWDFVRIADAMASMTSPSETGGLERYIRRLNSTLGKDYRLCFHELTDIRGVLTNQIHQVVSEILEEKVGLYPLMFFASGTVYIGKKITGFGKEKLISEVADKVIQNVRIASSSTFDPIEAIRPRESDFLDYAFLQPKESLLEAGYRKALKTNYKTDFNTILDGNEELFDISPSETEAFKERWFCIYNYLKIAESLVRDVIVKEKDYVKTTNWFCSCLGLKEKIRDSISENLDKLDIGLRKHVLVLSYHYLRGSDFNERSASSIESAEILNRLHEKLTDVFKSIETSEDEKHILEGLGIESELKDYLKEILYLSFEPIATCITGEPFGNYITEKKRSHTNICSLCSRYSKSSMPIPAKIFDDVAEGFSNRLLPKKKTSEKFKWCQICHLEFVMRTMAGLSPPPNIDKGKSKKLYLYVIPAYFFTPEKLAFWDDEFRDAFRRPTSVGLRDYGQSKSHAHLWLESQSFDTELMDEFLEKFQEQAEWIQEHIVRDDKSLPGERLLTTKTAHLNYQLFIWEKTAYGSTKDDSLVPTSSEMWAKAAFSACIISLLTSSKVVVTEKSYFPVTDPSSIKGSIYLDAPHNILRPILKHQSYEIALWDIPEMMSLLSAMWQINSDLKEKKGKTKDKHIAQRLEVLNQNPLAGAFFYKQYARLNDDATPFEIYQTACETLLKYKGGELMNIVKEMTGKSMELFLPPQKFERGKAHIYELVFRTAVSAIRKAPAQSIDEIKSFACGTLLKALDRRRQQTKNPGKDGKVNHHFLHPTQFAEKVSDFINILVDEILVNRCNGSIAQFNRLANSIADGIYCEIDRNIREVWKKRKEERKSQQTDENEKGAE